MTKEDIQQLKRSLGRKPFDERWQFDSSGFAACPFHNGDSPKSMHLHQQDDGAWTATCFSTCGKTFDAVAFIMEKDKVSFTEAIDRLAPKGWVKGTPLLAAPAPQIKRKKADPLTPELWTKMGA